MMIGDRQIVSQGGGIIRHHLLFFIVDTAVTDSDTLVSKKFKEPLKASLKSLITECAN